jgi:hypothetical protein
MTDENDALDTVETQLKVEPIDADTLGAADRARLTVEAQTAVAMALAELFIAFMESALGAEVGPPMDGNGNVIEAPKVDLLDAGGDSVV